MKIPLHNFFFLGLISLILCITGCHNESGLHKFKEINSSLANNINWLQKEPGITLTGFSSDPAQNLFKIGIGIDHNKLTTESLKKIFEAYLEASAAATSEHDPMKLLEPYNLRIEEIGVDKSSFSLVADKFAGSTELSWAEINPS